MSIWDTVGDIVMGGGILKPVTDKVRDIGGKILGIPDADEKRRQQAAMNDQIKAYRDQTELSRQELNKAKDAQSTEQRRIQEKQIRALRRNYRPAGILTAASSSQNDMSTKLGG